MYKSRRKFLNQNTVIRKLLMKDLNKFIKLKKISQLELAEILEITQPRASNLLNKKIELFSIDILVNFLGKLGVKVEFTCDLPVCKEQSIA